MFKVEPTIKTCSIGWLRLVALLTAICLATTATAQNGDASKDDSTDTFRRDIVPLLEQYCVECHLEDDAEGGIALDGFASQDDAIQAGRVWIRILDVIESGAMPPEEMPQPTSQQRQRIIDWIENDYFAALCSENVAPPAVVIRRLNRQEYDNTLRDLIGLELGLAKDFPADDIGFGYDNIGSALNVSPIHIEKYLRAAQQAMEAAIVLPDADPYSPAELIGLRTYPLSVEAPVEFEHHLEPGRYLVDFSLVRAGVDESVQPPWLKIGFGSDARRLTATRIQDETVVYRFWIQVNQQDSVVRIEVDEDPTADADDPATTIEANVSGDQRYGNNRGLHADSMVVRGPVRWEPDSLPQPHQRILFRQSSHDDSSRREVGKELITRFASQAFRRPVTEAETDRILAVFDLANDRGESFECATQIALTAVLVSPQFLYLVEPESSNVDRPLTEYELATRLSYYLWSTMPDEALLEAAKQGRVRSDLNQHVARMLADPKSAALVQNFVGQWLRLRNLDTVSPDPELFPSFGDELRDAMRSETEQFFAYVLRNNRSVLELLDADYTFLNETLAQHYGVQGVAGPEFRRVSLAPQDAQGMTRGGVLTQASVLTLTSNPNRTSPVKRGQFILQQLLGTPPPPPPPGVSELDESPQATEAASLRERMEQHRTNPQCAACHKQMDAIGFALENYDAVGRWRSSADGFPVDPSGQWSSSIRFEDAADLKQVLQSQAKKTFTRCLVENMLTYALGRSLQPRDFCTVEEIRRQLVSDQFRIQNIIVGIVQSDAFGRRGVGD